ncbi:mucin-2-like [Topomyia yanbarensis]|uniref:mucin-2-like n=1 Tax=Topomyia yanbarensis TaxID=2498891 RepID=UPI00273AD833|nr:mucin-2-like [Topomyia yanbarensis]
MDKHNCRKCDLSDSADNMVGCDTCETWLHYKCAGVSDSIADPERCWQCDGCKGALDSFSKISIASSRASKRSSRAELSLQMLQEQRMLKLKMLAEEDDARKRQVAEEEEMRQKLQAEEEERRKQQQIEDADRRKQRAAEDEDMRKRRLAVEELFLSQKYELAIAEMDEEEEGTSRRSKLSSRAGKDKVQKWLSKTEQNETHQLIQDLCRVEPGVQQSTEPPSTVQSKPTSTELSMAATKVTVSAPTYHTPQSSSTPQNVISGTVSEPTKTSIQVSMVATKVTVSAPTYQTPQSSSTPHNVVSGTVIEPKTTLPCNTSYPGDFVIQPGRTQSLATTQMYVPPCPPASVLPQVLYVQSCPSTTIIDAPRKLPLYPSVTDFSTPLYESSHLQKNVYSTPNVAPVFPPSTFTTPVMYTANLHHRTTRMSAFEQERMPIPATSLTSRYQAYPSIATVPITNLNPKNLRPGTIECFDGITLKHVDLQMQKT